MLSAGVPPQVVQSRLGHSKIEMTLGIYCHVLPGQQADAAGEAGGAPPWLITFAITSER